MILNYGWKQSSGNAGVMMLVAAVESLMLVPATTARMVIVRLMATRVTMIIAVPVSTTTWNNVPCVLVGSCGCPWACHIVVVKLVDQVFLRLRYMAYPVPTRDGPHCSLGSRAGCHLRWRAEKEHKCSGPRVWPSLRCEEVNAHGHGGFRIALSKL